MTFNQLIVGSIVQFIFHMLLHILDYQGGLDMDYKYKVDYQVIARRVKEVREAARLTQAEFAEKIGISTNAVAKLETNRMTTSLWTLVNISNVLHMDINYFLCDSSEQINETDELDLSLNSRLHGLSAKDKMFLLHIIEGLKRYNTNS